MSTRWYPLFQPGNPQLRIFLPNFWMKLIRGRAIDDLRPPALPNRVQFIVSMEMTRHDVKNYLERIYQVHPVNVNIAVRMGATKEVPTAQGRRVVKEDDYKVAYITLPEHETFTFPDIYPKTKTDEKQAEAKKQLEEVRQAQQKLKERSKPKPDLPGWFV